MEGFSGFTRNDWTKAQNYMQGVGTLDDVDAKTFLTDLRTAKNHDVSNIPCTNNFSDGGFSDVVPTNWEYQKPDDDNKYCPPFQPTCGVEGICTGNSEPPKLESPADKTLLRDNTDQDLRDASYCTGVFSNCWQEGKCTLYTDSLTPWGGKVDPNLSVYDNIIADANNNKPPKEQYEMPPREILQIKPCGSVYCQPNQNCVNNKCVKNTMEYIEGSEEDTPDSIMGRSLLGESEWKARQLTINDTEKLKQNNANFIEENSVKRYISKEGQKDSEIKLNSFKNSIDILNTKYIWSFNMPVNVISALSKLPDLNRINLGLKNFLMGIKQRDDFKNALNENNGDKEIKISYNKAAILTALYKLSKKKQIAGGKKWSEIITAEWIKERSFKTTNLNLKDLDTNKIPWGYKSRKAFEKKAPGKTDSWSRLGDTSDVGKHLYGNTGVRNKFIQLNPHPNDNPKIL